MNTHNADRTPKTSFFSRLRSRRNLRTRLILEQLEERSLLTSLIANAGSAIITQEGATATFQGSLSGGTAPYSYTWTYGDGSSNSGTLAAGSSAGTTASFVKTDTATHGTWKGVYGAAGYNVIGNATSYPAYATISATKNSSYTWASSTTNVRALQKASSKSTDRVAACWYTSTAMTIAVNLTDGLVHPVSFYALDWDTNSRSERIDVSDASSGKLLNSQTISGFTSGTYLTWNVSGSVQFTVTKLGGSNAVVSGLFLGSSVSSAQAGLSTTHTYLNQGTYTTTLRGTDATGQVATSSALVTVQDVAPSVTLTTAPSTGTSGTGVSFAASATDPSPLDQAAGYTFNWNFGDGITATGASVTHVYAAAGTYTLSVTATGLDGSVSTPVKQLETITAPNPFTASAGNPLTTQEGVSTTLQGSVSGGTAPYTYAWTYGDGPVSSGTTASFVSSDTTNQGNWKGVYGAAGYNVIGDATSYPTFAAITTTGTNNYTWAATTTDVRALLKSASGSTDRLAACWYAGSAMTVAVNLTDGLVHPVSFYALDWDSGGRSERIDVTDTATGQLLDSQTISSFNAGTYLNWNVSGSVQFTITNLAGVNAVVSGLFVGTAVAAGPMGLSATHTYVNQGTYTATLTATDSTGRTATSSTLVTVQDVAPTVKITSAPSAGSVGAAVSFAALATDPSPLDQAGGYSYAWKFGDGTTGTGSNPTHTYGANGTYSISVVATSVTDGATSVPVLTTILISAVAGSTVNIDANWLQQNGPAPYQLSSASTTYVLQTDVGSESSAFIVTAANVTLDLNGHKVTYDQNTAPGVTNGGFESGTSATDIPNWNVTGAPGAVRTAAIRGYWGNWCLQVPVAAGASATILSDPISIPKAGVDYCAMLQPKLTNTGTATLSVVDATTGAVLATGSSSDPIRGTLAYATFLPATTASVRIKMVVTAGAAAGLTAYLDHADMVRYSVVGIIASPAAYYVPAYLQAPGYEKAANVTIKNGTITDGTGRSYADSPIYARGINGLTVDHVTMYSAGASTNQIEADNVTTPTVTNCTLTNAMDVIDDRMRAFAALRFMPVSGVVTLNGNTIRGTQQNGIGVTGASYLTHGSPGYFTNVSNITSATINNNDIRCDSSWTDSYGIGLSGLHNFEIASNTIVPINGRGIYIDADAGITDTGTVHDNYVEARERANLEYSITDISATALRVRNGTIKNVTFTNNTFAAYTGPGMAWAAIGARISMINGWDGSTGENTNSNDLFIGNTFKAIVLAPDPTLATSSVYTGSQAWGLSLSRVDAGTGLTFKDNIMASNVTPLSVGDCDSYLGIEQDVSFIHNTIQMVTNEGVLPNSTGLRPFNSIAVGDWGNTVNDIRFISTQYTNGAQPGITFLSIQPKTVLVGWTLNLMVQNADLTIAPGVTVTIADRAGTQVYSGTTDANGKISGIRLITQTIAQTGTDPNNLTTDLRGPFTLLITKGTRVNTLTINPTSDLNQSFLLN